jgi:transcriptional regulator with XRE-family HTH domain
MNLRKKLNNKDYRDAFTSEYIYSRIPLKIRAMRDRRGISQQQLAEMAGVKQEWISKLENPNYGRLTLTTLLKLASAFDVALNVDFVPFSEILERSTHLSPESFDVPSYQEENQVAVAQPVAGGLESYAELLSPLQQPGAASTEASVLAATKQSAVRPLPEKEHNRSSGIFINRDRELLVGKRQEAAAIERPSALAAAAG